MSSRIRDTADAVSLWLDQHRWTRIARGAVTGFIAHDVLQYAGSMAYFSVLSIVNLLVLGVVAISFVLGEGAARQFVIDQVAKALPLDAGDVANLLDRAVEARGGVTIIGLVLLTWSALGVFGALSGGISRVFTGTPHRPFWKERAIGLVLLAATGVLALASVGLGLLTEIIGESISSRLTIPGTSAVFATLAFLIPVVLVFVAFVFVYRVVPSRPLPIADAAAGALVATILWTVLRIGFTLYATRIANYDTVFGPLGTAISLLVFLYFSSVVLLLGAEVARASAQELKPHAGAVEVVGEPADEPMDAPG
jgi:membrane protein